MLMLIVCYYLLIDVIIPLLNEIYSRININIVNITNIICIIWYYLQFILLL